MKRARDWSPAQASLMPPSPRDWLKEDHLVYFLLDLVPSLDLGEIDQVIQAKDGRGTRPYSARMMVLLMLYGYCIGKVSSRKLEKATYEEVPFRVLCAGHHPDHCAISNFRKTHLKALGGLFHQILRLCQEAGLVKLGHVALDGTKLKASASKHKANSYAGLERNEERLVAEIEELLKQAASVDAEEDARFGEDRTGEELPDGLRSKSERLQRIQKAKAALEADAALTKALERKSQAERSAAKAKEQGDQDAAAAARAEKAAAIAGEAANEAIEQAQRIAEDAAALAEKLNSEADDAKSRRSATLAGNVALKAEKTLEATIAALCDDESDDDDQGGAATTAAGQVDRRSANDADALPERRVKADADGYPVADAQRNFTDPDSHLMKDGNGYSQAFNCQAAVDEAHQVIVAACLTNQASDSQHLVPMLNAVIENCGAPPITFTADAGYSSEVNLKHCEDVGTDAYIPCSRKTPDPKAEGDAKPSQAKPKSPIMQAMAEKIATEEGRAKYARRKFVGEAPFGNIKAARGFRQMLLRGIEQTRHEWNLICAGHNLLKLYKARTA